jgi:hypothetical protein
MDNILDDNESLYRRKKERKELAERLETDKEFRNEYIQKNKKPVTVEDVQRDHVDNSAQLNEILQKLKELESQEEPREAVVPPELSRSNTGDGLTPAPQSNPSQTPSDNPQSDTPVVCQSKSCCATQTKHTAITIKNVTNLHFHFHC